MAGVVVDDENSAFTMIGEGDLTKKFEECVNVQDQLEQVWQSKSECESRYRRLQEIAQNLQQRQQLGTPAADLPQYMQQLKDTYDRHVRCTQVVSILESKVAKNLESYTNGCEILSAAAGSAMEQWKWQQKSAQYGVVVQNDCLNEITRKYQIAMEHAFRAWQLLKRFNSFRNQTQGQSGTQIDATLQPLFLRGQRLLGHILNSSFVITTQPPMVVKNKIRLEVTLLAAIDKLGLETQSVQMNARIINEDTAIDLKNKPDSWEQKIATVGHMDSANVKTKQLQRLSQNTLGFELKNMKVTVDSRKQATKTGEAIMKKYYFLCMTEITFNELHFKLHAFSLPFMVSVHGTQDVELYAKAFWDTAFSNNLDSVPMIGEPEVPWRTMGPGIAAIFSILTKGARRLTPHDVEYLKYRLFNGCVPDTDPVVTWQKFYKDRQDRIGGGPNEPRKQCPFSFWEWLFRIGDMIQEKSGRDTGVSELWEERFIEGFISKQEAESRLIQAPEPMMMIRFSDNQLAGLSIVCLNPYTREIDHLRPFKFKEEIEKMTLPMMVVNCHEVKDINIIYPDKARKILEDKVAASKRTEEPEGGSNYKNRTVVLTTGDKTAGGRSPFYSPSPSPAHFSGMRPVNMPPTPVHLMHQLPIANVKLETRSPVPPTGNGFGMSDVEYLGNFPRIPAQNGQYDEYMDDQMMQDILSDLTKTDDDENDVFVHMVQTFDSATLNGEAARGNCNNQQQPHPSYGTNFPNTDFDFEMSGN